MLMIYKFSIRRLEQFLPRDAFATHMHSAIWPRVHLSVTNPLFYIETAARIDLVFRHQRL